MKNYFILSVIGVFGGAGMGALDGHGIEGASIGLAFGIFVAWLWDM